MKYFTLSYFLNKDDYKEYDGIYKSDMMKINSKKLLLYFLPVIICFFVDIGYAVLFLVIGALSFFLPFIISREYSKKRDNTFVFKREMTVDFYADHLVTRLLPDGRFKSSTETHYPFKNVIKIIESSTYFYFIFRDEAVLLIPKSAVNEENYEMIENLISNLFSDRYIFVNPKN